MSNSTQIAAPNRIPKFPNATEIAFASYNGKYTGQACCIVGRGPTEFDYARLAEVTDPIFFINDAVSMEKYARSDTYFFAHDAQMLPWMNGQVRSTIVVPIDGKVFHQTPGITLAHTGNIVFYRWRDKTCEDLLRMSRDEIAVARQLYTHTGTIHSVLHFIWFCGFTRVSLIGCDGINAPYDPRLANVSNSKSANYAGIARVQRLLTELFGLEAEYIMS